MRNTFLLFAITICVYSCKPNLYIVDSNNGNIVAGFNKGSIRFGKTNRPELINKLHLEGMAFKNTSNAISIGGLVYYFDEHDNLREIEIRSSRYRLQNGLTVGSTIAEVKVQMGKQTLSELPISEGENGRQIGVLRAYFYPNVMIIPDSTKVLSLSLGSILTYTPKGLK